MFGGCKCCIHPEYLSDDLSEWTKIQTLQLVFVSCFCDVSAFLHICLVWLLQISKTNGFSIFFLSVGERAQDCFCLPNFDVIRIKQVEMEPVYQGCWSSQIFNASASSSSGSFMLPSSLPLPHVWNFLLPLPAPDRISRFRVHFRSLSKCFFFHKNLTASTFLFNMKQLVIFSVKKQARFCCTVA